MVAPARVESGTSATAQWAAVSVAPDPRLCGIAGRYSEFRERSHSPIDRVEPASAAVVVVVEFEGPLTIPPHSFHAFAAGSSRTPTPTWHPGLQHCIEFRLTPLGARRVFDMPMRELGGTVVDLDEIPATAGLAARLAECGSWGSRFELLDEVLLGAAAEGPEPYDEVAYAWHRLVATGGTTPIKDILDEIGWSRRRLAQRFDEQIGLTPKSAAIVLRFGRAVELLSAPGHRSLASIAEACGYYDQAHFNRDFLASAGCTPGTFVQDHAGPAS